MGNIHEKPRTFKSIEMKKILYSLFCVSLVAAIASLIYCVWNTSDMAINIMLTCIICAFATLLFYQLLDIDEL